MAKDQKRFPLIDLTRGIAITAMVYFHFCFNLSYFGFLETDFYNSPYWVNLRTIIVTCFMFLVGVSLTLSARKDINYPRFWRREALIVGLACAITLVSYFLFPGRTIVFGVLHFIALASVFALLFLRFKWLNLVLGAGLIALGAFYENTWFDQYAVHWLGLMTHKPATEDYAPVLPWFGVVLTGMCSAKVMLSSTSWTKVFASPCKSKPATLLSLMGRHSLSIYIIHQLILYPLVAGFAFIL